MKNYEYQKCGACGKIIENDRNDFCNYCNLYCECGCGLINAGVINIDKWISENYIKQLINSKCNGNLLKNVLKHYSKYKEYAAKYSCII